MTDLTQFLKTMSPLKIALAAQQLADKRALLEAEPIAIIGMGCRYPGEILNPEAFWHLLQQGQDAITEIPAYRWPSARFYDADPEAPGKMYTRYGGFLGPVDTFDATFFGISPREALNLDPQQRLLLEVSWEALENAFIIPQSLQNSATGVFIGATSHDYTNLLFAAQNSDYMDAYMGTGHSLSVAAGRLSYTLGLTGPSVVVDTACSSSLVAIHLACQSLRHRECTLALAGGVQLNLSPEFFIAFSKARMLSADGRCKTFSAEADGYGRGEGCGIIVLKRLLDAVRAGDTIHALIRSSSLNQDGKSSGLTVPNGPAQQAVIRQALERGGVDPAQIDYLEAHGTGTALGDPIEMGALHAVFGPQRQNPLWVGSVKTNIGHLEAAAGIAGVMKVVLALQKETLPPHLHFKNPNPYIDWKHLAIPTTAQAWPRGEKSRLAGVSSFGFSGTNAHVILEEAPLPPPAVNAHTLRPYHLVTLSAKAPSALKALAQRYQPLTAPLSHIAHTTTHFRSHFNYRRAVVASSTSQLAEQLQTDVPTTPTRELTIAFLFSGQGAQYTGVARQLYETHAGFRETLNECQTLLTNYLDTPLLTLIYPQAGKEQLIHETQYTQPALFAIEYALAKLWNSWGIQPHFVMGHSVGEYVAACVAGVFSLEEGLKLVTTRGQLMQTACPLGAMLSVTLPSEQVAEWLTPFAGRISIAAYNGPASTVVSGECAAIKELTSQLIENNLGFKHLAVSRAFHSPLMEPIRTAFTQVAAQIRYAEPQIPLVSNLTGQFRSAFDADYWYQHLRQPVQFATSMATLQAQGVNVFIEIGPKPVLLGMGRQCLPDTPGLWLPSLRESQVAWQSLLESAGRLYEAGATLNWPALEDSKQRVDLPTYPFQRQSYWFTPKRTPLPLPVTQPATWFYQLQWEAQPLSALRESCPRPAIPATYTQFWAHLESLCKYYLIDTLMDLGWDAELKYQNIPTTLPSLLQKLRIDPIHHRYFKRLLEILREDEFLTCQEGVWELTDIALEVPELPVDFQKETIEASLLHFCGQGLTSVLRGYYDPLSLLFPQGDLVTASHFYRATPVAKAMNSLVAEVVVKLAGQRPVRILEIGAGTGATTVSVLPRLSPARVEYTFTDISVAFLNQAQTEFKAYPFVRYELLDIEQPPTVTAHYDIIVVSHVLHATADLTQTLTHVWQLLKPSGFLVLLELDGAKPSRVLDLTFGMTVGWWRFNDLQLRPEYPLLSTSQWHNLLESNGFSKVESLPSAWPMILLVAQKSVPVKNWLIFTDQGGAGAALAEQLRARGDQCTLLFPSQEQLLEKTLTSEVWTEIVHLWSLDTPPPNRLTTAQLNTTLEWTCHSVLRLVQALPSPTPKLWLVTNDAVNATLHGLAASPLWGMARALALELPEFRCTCLDINPFDLRDLWAELHSLSLEDQVLYRHRQRFVARLKSLIDVVPQPLYNPAEKEWLTPQFPIHADASYLITGGLGGLGLEVAQWLVAQGARYLVFVGRRGTVVEGQQAILTALENQGVQISVFCADVSDYSALQRVFSAIELSLPPLRGVIHAAGQLADSTLLQENWHRFTQVLAPKVQGAWHLHQLTQKLPLDFFILFSSAASLVGAAGQANHCAANAFLDALAHYRQAQGLPALSINWGAWAGIGAAAKYQQIQIWHGIISLTPTQGIALFERVFFKQDPPQLGIMGVDWNLYLQYLAYIPPLLLEFLVNPQPSHETRTETHVSEPFQPSLPEKKELSSVPLEKGFLDPQLNPQERREKLAAYLNALIAKTLRLEQLDPQQALTDVGLDSLMAVEIRNLLRTQLSAEIPLSTLLKGSNVSELTTIIEEQLSQQISEKPSTGAWVSGEL